MAKIRVFLSYSSTDRPIAERIHIALIAAGYDVFFDRDSLPAGESFDVKILDAIGGSHLLIFLVSPDSIKAGVYTLTELGFAKRRWTNPAGRVLPVLIREIDLDILPVYLRPVTLLEPKGNVAAEVVAAVKQLRKRRWLYSKWAVISLSTIAIAVAIGYYTIQMREYNCHLAASNTRAFANRMIDYANTASQRELDIIDDLDSLRSEEQDATIDIRTDRSLDWTQKNYKVDKLRKFYSSKWAKIEKQLMSVVAENNFHMRKLAEESIPYRVDLFDHCLGGGDTSIPESDFSFDMKQSITDYISTHQSSRFIDFVNKAKKLEELSDRVTGERGKAVAKSEREDFSKVITNSIGMKFVLIPVGKFKMGSSISSHDVILSNQFYLQATEVTQGQWKKVMGYNPSHHRNCGDICPVEMVSWQDVIEFISKLNTMEGEMNYRLPTEAEWEYAARAGTATAFSFGDNVEQIDDFAWFSGNSEDKIHPVGTKKPNPWGLYDMHGNVWEWVEDDWHKNYIGAPDNGRAWVDNPRDFARVLRGGGYSATAPKCSSADRVRLPSSDTRWSIGFRLASSVILGR